MKENRVAQNNEILNNRAQFERIPHYNGENVSYSKIQPPWIRIRGVPVVQLPCAERIFDVVKLVSEWSLFLYHAL
ncbi:hypothetical protein T02_14753 [Trichinella nativa]|uniref:Uncharacterized protein n=1 Tax=Trichinella nativa TaxID=6335 RepID=A0A0V1L0X0_9BILA|nr:hypothetical protein T02_14753 [Trichinella nativa]